MSVLSYLKARADAAILASSEEDSIRTSIETLDWRLNSYFTSQVSEKFRFGSSTRGTILPRAMDSLSDVDYMVVFADSNIRPQSYLDRLKSFAEFWYSSSDVKQSSPSIILELNHIRFDLVPAIGGLLGNYSIPRSYYEWQSTNPNDFNSQLSAKNNANLYLVKPAIRLAKFWNAKNGYVYESFSLEKKVLGIGFYSSYNLQQYLFEIFDSMYTFEHGEQWRREKVERAHQIVSTVRAYEAASLNDAAEREVRKLIPE